MDTFVGQGQLWSMAAEDWAELQEPVALPLWEAVLDATSVGHGTHLLDAGCGAGGASTLAAQRGAQVNGLDAAEALLAIARRRVLDGDFRLGDLEDLPYADGIFDAILAADVLAYVTAPVSALRELRRVCAPGGRVAIAVWCTAEQSEQHAIMDAVRAIMPVPPGLEPLPLSNPGALEALVAQAGLRMCSAGTVACPAAYPDQETAWQAQASAGPLQAVLRIVGEPRLKATLLRALAPFTTSTGGVHLRQHARYVIAVPNKEGRDSLVKGDG